ncbi:hypothetical protein TRV_03607 [Trichophyton verrucosum HKI 0517]|uniref:Uncharacterized protein n=1 Tax=Trichophyton verrucosum (strain HKI 0517) TaxID=663202 RepID=D4D917_TRIVH|nr:uncharacterized protein TRV_03607 [Trichophyton verrucosum HKI 0517]EFE41665.1 hypothetical protein TRV_03607 [Trichophyton verrucosum HKI 0517]
MQPRSASRGSQYIRGTRPRDRQQQLQQLPPLHTKQHQQHPQDGYDGKRYYSPQQQQQQQQYQAYPGPASASPDVPEDEEPVYLPSIGNFQSLHSLVNNLPQFDTTNTTTTTTASPTSTAAASTSTNPWAESFSFPNGRPLASRTRHLNPVDRPFSVAVGGHPQQPQPQLQLQSQSAAASYAPAPRSTAARPMSTAAARNEPYRHAYSASSVPLAASASAASSSSSDAASIERQAYQAVSAVRRSPGSLLRKESYHAAYPAAGPAPVTTTSTAAVTSTATSASGSSSSSSSLTSVHQIPQPTRRPPPVPVQAPASTQIPSYHAYSGTSLAASNSSSSLDKQGQPTASSTSTTSTTSSTASTAAARPMSAAPGAPKTYHAYSANPSASASTSSLPQADTAASTRRTLPSAVRSHSYYGTGSPAAPPAAPPAAGVATNPMASSSTSSLDRQVRQSTAHRSASVAAARPRPTTSGSAAVARRATSNAAAMPRPASAVAVRSQSYNTPSGTPAASDMARRNTVVFDSDLTRNKNPQPNPPLIPLQQMQAAQAPASTSTASPSSAEQASKQPRFYALLRASMVVPDTVQIATVEEETTAIRQRSVYGPQPRPRSSRRSQWPRASSRLFTGSSMTDITDKDEADPQTDVVVESRASMSCPSLVPTSNLASASSTTLSTPKTSGEDYKSQYRKTKSFPLEEPSGTTTPTQSQVKASDSAAAPTPEAPPAPTSKPPAKPPSMSRTVTAPADIQQPQARKLIKRNPSAPKPRPNSRVAQTSRSMSLVGTPRLPTSGASSPPPLPRAMSVHIPSPATAQGQAADRSKKPRLTSLWSGLFRLRVSS